jgi:hypothetical protein
VWRLEIDPLYGGALLARWLPFVEAGGEYAGRLSGFDTAGSDATSGVDDADCSADQTYTGPDGTSLTVNGSCTDGAGNVGNGTSAAFDFDDTNPGVTVSPDRAPDFGGWYNADVVFNTAGTDATSGVSDANCSANQTYSGPDGTGLTVGGSCTDNAGNVGSGTSASFKFDNTNPTVTVTAARVADHNGWYDAPVAFNTAGSDATSGVTDADCTADQTYSTPDGTGLTVGGSCTDAAGNVGTGTSAAFDFDDTNPGIVLFSRLPAANSFGWNNAAVTVTWSCSDATSGPVTGTVSDTKSAEGADQVANGTCEDIAGNTNGASYVNIDIDLTKPTVSLVGGPANGASYYFGSVPAAPACSASDGLSGLNGSCSVSGYLTTVGTHTVSATAADKAGNSKTVSNTDTVLAWTLTGFYSAVDMGGVVNSV